MNSLLKLLAIPAIFLALPASADPGIYILDPYARVIGGHGTVYFMIDNHELTEDVLLSATSTVAGMVHLMTSGADANGVMKMSGVPDGFSVSSGAMRTLKGASDHIMLMGMTQTLKPGDEFTLILTFKNVGDIVVTVPVDNKRTTEPTAGPTPYDAQSTDAGGND